MERLTTAKDVQEMGIHELAHNCMFIKGGETWYRDFEREVKLRDLIRETIKEYEGELDEQLFDDELLDTILLENLQYPTEGMNGFIAVFNMVAWSSSELREALKRYEDTGLTPAEVQELKERDTAKVPIKVRETEIRYTSAYRCPNCGGNFSGIGIADFCYHCGQRLKWED